LGRRCLQAQPYRIDIHAHRWGEVVRSSADYFRQIREAVDHDIAFDAHAKIFEPKLAAQLGNALAPYDPLFFEEPLRPENMEAWGDLNRQTHCVLATGSRFTTAMNSCACCR
jgi:galactonate dehydratase